MSVSIYRNPSRRVRRWYEKDTDIRRPQERVANEARMEQVSSLYALGYTYEEIARETGYSRATVARDLKVYYERENQDRGALGGTAVDIQLARYRRILKTWMPIAELAYDPETRTPAMEEDKDGKKYLDGYTISLAYKAQKIVNDTLMKIDKLQRLGVYGDPSFGRASSGPIQLTINQVVIGTDSQGKPILANVDDVEEGLFEDVPELEAGDADSGD